MTWDHILNFFMQDRPHQVSIIMSYDLQYCRGKSRMLWPPPQPFREVHQTDMRLCPHHGTFCKTQMKWKTKSWFNLLQLPWFLQTQSKRQEWISPSSSVSSIFQTCLCLVFFLSCWDLIDFGDRFFELKAKSLKMMFKAFPVCSKFW